MSKLAIVVDFRVKAGQWRDFDAHIRAHAARTLAEEAGCERFDVLQPLGADGAPDESRVMLFELYVDEAAFDAHRSNPRMAEVGAHSAAMLDGRTLSRCRLD